MTGPVPITPAAAATATRGVWGAQFVWVTGGAVALIFLAALQALAVTTIMPIVSAELGGERLYAVVFAGMLATSVVGMVAAGAWCDRRGVLGPLSTAVVLFVAGLIIAGAAPAMELLVVGRLVQGLGSGGQIVTLYVVVARVYPARLHGRVFAAFSAAWVVPSLVGPFLAGLVAEVLHWRWVFLGVAVLTLAAFLIVMLRLSGMTLGPSVPSRQRVLMRMLCALLVAAGALALSIAETAGSWAAAVVVGAVALIAVAVRPLLPAGALRVRPGLPSVVIMRGLIAGALFGAEIYVPYLLIDEYAFSATWAGLALTTAALAWAVTAEVQGRVGDRLGNRRIAVFALVQMLVAFVAAILTALLHLHPALLIVCWSLAGSGMGLIYPRLTVLTLAYSKDSDQGFNSAALSISDAVGSASSIATMGLVYLAFLSSGQHFVAVFAVALCLTLLAFVPGLRLGHEREAD